LMIDVGSCVNIITKTALEKMGLNAEPHLYPYNVNLVEILLNLLPNVIRSLSTCLATMIIFGVMFKHRRNTHFVG